MDFLGERSHSMKDLIKLEGEICLKISLGLSVISGLLHFSLTERQLDIKHLKQPAVTVSFSRGPNPCLPLALGYCLPLQNAFCLCVSPVCDVRSKLVKIT